MNPRRVVIFMTMGMFFILSLVMILAVGGLPPWPVWFWMVVSHVFFCTIILRVKPYRGPYRVPLQDSAADWNKR